MKDELAKANEIIGSKQKRFERIRYLLNDRVAPNAERKIEVTKKGVFVLTATKPEEFGIEVFDLDGVNPKSARWALALWAHQRGDHFFIRDIPGGRGRGHGENAMWILLAHIEKLNEENMGKQQINYIIGDLSASDKSFRDSQKAFYEKMGFIPHKL